ncbi:regulated by circadian rhythms/ protein binding protein [Cryphonectria parasitica EP155]|uniref:Regulated by circadian rhythms/ protein binding protein n=1 Tax=Cryphonectria parasitica (strain ATCC 38755 / EP155) TaxID=660469 RepID=A0A9P5CMK6_CRYP1|nr:regulated by circadian rhythms/ protein binding protein [Cryphonectria parasitica EP155]KAF3762980.1 regulated by circadian rhythms/ protein binding protein [Cryphonectria parasitica EP155]
MQRTHPIYKRVPRTLRTCPRHKTTVKTTTRPLTTTTNKMSFFPRSYFAPEASFTPLFRLLDDFDNYSREVSAQGNTKAGSRRALPTFSPRFDVKETEAGYELHGELPGVDKENVSIEFSEPQTLVISGRSERTYTSGTPPAGLVESGGSDAMSGAITEGSDKDTASVSHKATVEDEAAETAKEQQGTQITKAEPQQQKPKEKFWVSERSVGEFSRTFSFPTPVDQEAVAANLNNGILSVVVPKAKKHESRRIAVN